jgi:hypothetical protein
LSDFSKILIFRTDFRKNSNTNFHEISLVGAELFYADRKMGGQTGMMKPKVAFLYFAKAPKNEILEIHCPTLHRNVFY